VGDSQNYLEESKETALAVIQVTFATDKSRHYPGCDAECTAKQSTNPYQCNGPARALLEFIGKITMAIIGDNGNNVLDGGNGKDLIRGGDGDDILNGENGKDTLIGDRGSDRSNGGNGDDRIIWNNGDGSDFNDGGNGHDVQEVNGSGAQGDEFVVKANGPGFLFDRVNLVPFKLTDTNIEKLEVNGGGGDDKLTVGNMAGTSLKSVLFNGGEGNDVLDASKANIKIEANGGTGHDKLTGGSADDILKGDAGDDVITGGHGNDKLFGGAGHDTFFVESFKEIADFQHGIDQFFIV
jgi:Ca2+-binding RTX toxin-like protein